MLRQTSHSEADLLSAGAMCYIYTLHASNDPEGRPRYVGFTIRPKRREYEHNNGCDKNGRKAAWIKELTTTGERATLTIIQAFRSDDLTERGITEATWIDLYRRKFPDLLNDLGGGQGVAKCSESLRKKMSANAKRIHSDPEYRAMVSARTKRAWENPEIRARQTLANKRIWEDARTRAKQSATCKCRWKDPKERAKKSAETKRYCADPSVRAKMSVTFKMAWKNPELRARMGEIRKRLWANPEYRKNMMAARRRGK